MMYTLRQYLIALANPRDTTRTLRDMQLVRDDEGRIRYSSGNNAIVFCVRHEGRLKALRLYRRPLPRMKQVYGDECLEREITLVTEHGIRQVDVVLTDWIEGPTLTEELIRLTARRDVERLTRLCETFDREASEWVADDWAHGDLKPDNLVVTADGELRLIDWDALYLPKFAGQSGSELGTASFQHPLRTLDHFHAGIDDFPAALIATALHLLRVHPEVGDEGEMRDGLLFHPSKIASNPLWHRALRCFEERGWAAQYRIARSLTSLSIGIPRLSERLAWARREVLQDAGWMSDAENEVSAEELELYVEDGLCGFRTAERVVIPPIYDRGFDFSEGLAAVCVGTRWHFIDPAGRVVLHCPECEAVKPFCHGEAILVCNGRRCRMDRSGKMLL